jgi:hypothetical protein
LKRTTGQKKTEKKEHRLATMETHRLQFQTLPGMKQNIKAAFFIAFAACAVVASATPCTPALGRQVFHLAQCVLTCLPLGALFSMAPKKRRGGGKGKGKGGGKGKGKGDPGDGVDEEEGAEGNGDAVDEEGEEAEEGQAVKKRKRGPTVPPSGLTCVCMSVSLHVPTY